VQAWGLLEEAAGHVDKARELFEIGAKADPSHLYIWQVSGAVLCPLRVGVVLGVGRTRELVSGRRCERGCSACSRSMRAPSSWNVPGLQNWIELGKQHASMGSGRKFKSIPRRRENLGVAAQGLAVH
jgi:hypothetical protein